MHVCDVEIVNSGVVSGVQTITACGTGGGYFDRNRPLNTKCMDSRSRTSTNAQLPKKFFHNMPVELREFYEQKPQYQSLFKEFDVATYCLTEVAEKVKCYRFQLGNVVTKVGKLFHGIFEKSLHTNLKLIKEFRDKVEGKLKNNIKGLEQLEIEKKDRKGMVQTLRIWEEMILRGTKGRLRAGREFEASWLVGWRIIQNWTSSRAGWMSTRNTITVLARSFAIYRRDVNRKACVKCCS